MAESKICKCGSSNKIYCKNCSKIVMCILLKNGNDELKYTNNRGQLSNPVWYSPLKHNRKPERDIIEGMLRRFYESPLVSATTVVQFYTNKTSNLLFSHRL